METTRTTSSKAHHQLSAIHNLDVEDDESDEEYDDLMTTIQSVPSSRREYLAASSAVLNNIGAIYHERNEHGDAMKYYMESLQMHIQEEPPVGAPSNTQMTEQQFKTRYTQAKQLEAYLKVGKNAPHLQTRSDLANVMHQRTRLMGMNYVFVPIRMEGKIDRSITVFNVSLLALENRGNCEKTIALLNLAIDSLSPLSSPYLAASINTNLGYIHYMMGEYKEAVTNFQDALESATEAYIYENDKTATEQRPRMLRFVVAALLNLARALDASKCFEESMLMCSEAETFLQSHAGSGIMEPYPTSKSCFDLSAILYVKACIHHHNGDHAQARRLYQHFLQDSQAKLGLHHPRVAASLYGMGMICLKLGNPQDAMEPLLASLDIRRRAFGEDNSEVADSLQALGRTLRARGEYGDALEMHKKALAIRRSVLGHDHLFTMQSASEVARIHQVRGELDEALVVCKDLLRVSRERLGANHKFVAFVLSILGSTLQDMGQTRKANAAFLDAFEIHQDANRLRSELLCVKSIASFRKENHDAAAA